MLYTLRSSYVKKIIKLYNFKSLHCTTKLLNKNENQFEKISLLKLNNEEINRRLLTFFDTSVNWKKEEVKTGRSWRKDELRIKNNSDLHKLWYILYKERNMLLTMQEVAEKEIENMSSPERIDKVEESMKNIEEVIKERNKAYWELEVGNAKFVEQRKVFRRNVFGQWKWITCSEHLIPYWMNNKWRKLNAPGFGQDVTNFNRKLREKNLNIKQSSIFKQAIYCRRLMKRFPDLDLEYLKEKFPEVDIQHIKENLNEWEQETRSERFHSILYHKRKDFF